MAGGKAEERRVELEIGFEGRTDTTVSPAPYSFRVTSTRSVFFPAHDSHLRADTTTVYCNYFLSFLSISHNSEEIECLRFAFGAYDMLLHW